ncbi:four-helix bundle copper-binding protein [Novosphingobium sp. 9]|uniref:four-helix bundle copper-binding protein n=1 Tax=Novosphingobium sp. 9 TaxID=2025349 RepID=UPI0021B4FA96|nr:four-helix bundle copper-binding protein [Novosphingobium sp. 9]
MIALHPDVDTLNEELATAARHALFCAALCTSCADACIAEDEDMRQCIRACLDCADVCGATARLAMRHTGSNSAVLRTMVETCVITCESCAEECGRHDHEHCRLCAEMCRECASDCRQAFPAI